MENASKALLIAAAVLVVIILVAVGMKIYSSTTGTGKVATDTGSTISKKTGDATDLAISQITGKKNAINYGTKTKETVEPGDDIVIGGTEKFKVFSKTETEIKAMPYYNLKLDSNPMRQATAETANSAGTSTFSTSAYWTKGESTINMNDSRNLIQQYITKYQKTLEEFGAEGIQVRIGNNNELKNSGITNVMRNQSQSKMFWIGTGDSGVANGVMVIYESGSISPSYAGCSYNSLCGVRPIIIIK